MTWSLDGTQLFSGDWDGDARRGSADGTPGRALLRQATRVNPLGKGGVIERRRGALRLAVPHVEVR